MGFGTLALFAGVGVATAIGSSVLTALGKGEIAKQGSLAVELVMWGLLITMLAGDITEALTRIGGLASQFPQIDLSALGK